MGICRRRFPCLSPPKSREVERFLFPLRQKISDTKRTGQNSCLQIIFFKSDVEYTSMFSLQIKSEHFPRLLQMSACTATWAECLHYRVSCKILGELGMLLSRTWFFSSSILSWSNQPDPWFLQKRNSRFLQARKWDLQKSLTKRILALLVLFVE